MYQKSTIIRYQKNWYQIACQTRQKPVPVLWHRFLAQISGMFVISFNFLPTLQFTIHICSLTDQEKIAHDG